MTLSDYQNQRVEDVRLWYRDVYCQLGDDVPVSIRYMTLWAIFNALYNIADYPKVALKSVSVIDGKIIPKIFGRKEGKKLSSISKCFANNEEFTTILVENHKNFIKHLSLRTPQVQQPENTTSIRFECEGHDYTIDLTHLHGIASLDNRVILNNGEVLFQYYFLDFRYEQNILPIEPQKFYKQLVFMLYQLRNNIVHGGSAAFFMDKKELSEGAIGILDSLIQYLFSHPDSLELDDEE